MPSTENTTELTTATMNPDMCHPLSLVEIAPLVDPTVRAGIVTDVARHVLHLVVAREAEAAVIRVRHRAESQDAEQQVRAVHLLPQSSSPLESVSFGWSLSAQRRTSNARRRQRTNAGNTTSAASASQKKVHRGPSRTTRIEYDSGATPPSGSTRSEYLPGRRG